MLRPKFRDFFDVIPESHDRLQIRSSEMTAVLKGTTVEQVISKLLPLMDGHHTVAEIVAALDGVADPDVVRTVIDKLSDARFIKDAGAANDSQLSEEELQHYRKQLVFFEVVTEATSAALYQQALKESRLAIVGAGDLAARVAIEAARIGVGQINVTNLDSAESIRAGNPFVEVMAGAIGLDDHRALEEFVQMQESSLIVLALDRPEPSLLNQVNDLSQRLKVPVMHCQAYGTSAVVGPLVVPKQTACLLCHHLRVSRNLDYYQEHHAWEKWTQSDGRGKRAAPSSFGPFIAMVAGIAVVEISKHLSGFFEPETYGRFITVNALTLEVIPHQVLRIPRCPSCGNAAGMPSFSVWQEPK